MCVRLLLGEVQCWVTVVWGEAVLHSVSPLSSLLRSRAIVISLNISTQIFTTWAKCEAQPPSDFHALIAWLWLKPLLGTFGLFSHHILNWLSFYQWYFDFEPHDGAHEIDYASFEATSGWPNTIQTLLLHMVALFHESCLGTFIVTDVCECWQWCSEFTWCFFSMPVGFFSVCVCVWLWWRYA